MNKKEFDEFYDKKMEEYNDDDKYKRNIKAAYCIAGAMILIMISILVYDR